ncbi:putative PIN domain protein [Candidatus Termititenax aidoneus]|uniref:PIN domain protein n=1 Tax=Termititenax aidoneus TaxID=2218524 RepID=A0A388TCQ1_TERA1|nr:putative PIN domain protein [Candidatus Termititenax aidoneus]
MENKLKIYLDTSVISHLDAPDASEKMADTLQLWKILKTGKHKVFLSQTTLDELAACPEPKGSRLAGFLDEIPYTKLPSNDTVMAIAEKFIDFGVLKQKNYADCLHIAAAIVGECDIILSWNFKHIVNHKTIVGVKAVTLLEGRREILIYAPSMLTGGEND